MTERSAAQRREESLVRHVEWLKRMVLHADRAGGSRGRRISFLYRAADNFARRAFSHSFCANDMQDSSGCATGSCCRCAPDVFQYERELLDLLPKRIDATGYCPFFHLTRRTCGIYGVRPFACRVYFNFGASAHCCQNPTDYTLQIFDTLKRHLEPILGPYQGGYRHGE